MNTNQPLSLDQSEDNVTQLKRKALDGQVVDWDWLTPMADDTQFIVSQYADQMYLECYTKVCNFKYTVMVLEHFNDQQYNRYVWARTFCKRYTLIETI